MPHNVILVRNDTLLLRLHRERAIAPRLWRTRIPLVAGGYRIRRGDCPRFEALAHRELARLERRGAQCHRHAASVIAGRQPGAGSGLKKLAICARRLALSLPLRRKSGADVSGIRSWFAAP